LDVMFDVCDFDIVAAALLDCLIDRHPVMVFRKSQPGGGAEALGIWADVSLNDNLLSFYPDRPFLDLLGLQSVGQGGRRPCVVVTMLDTPWCCALAT
jgi:hypothetical protein